MNYQQAISFLQSFPDSERGTTGQRANRNLKMPVSAMRNFLERIGNPQNKRKTIHITGSKGKGSTATFISSILNKACFRTALFTSPHIHSYTERIAFDLRPVSEKIFCEGLADLKTLIHEFEKEGEVFSTFGILTALFFHLVEQSQPEIDWQIIEVGLGGRDDLTNVFDKKEAAVITPISLEHTAILGSTRHEIAENKTGIITPDCLTILSPQLDEEITALIENICLQKQSQFIPVTNKNLPCKIQMFGEHQIDNAATALALAKALQTKGHKISDQAISQGLASANLPGRFEIIDNNIVLDGAHNGDSAAALKQTLQMVFPNQPVIFILGMNQDKNIEDIFIALKEKAKTIITTKSDNYRSLSPAEIKDRIIALNNQADINSTDNIKEALALAKSKQISNEIICICGSFYLVAEARELLTKNAQVAN